MKHELLTIDARAGHPGTLLRAGHSGGRLLYLELRTSPVVQVAALDPDDVRSLRNACDLFLHEHAERGPHAGPAPLVGGAVSRSLADAAARWGQAGRLTDEEAELVGPPAGSGTVQVRTVSAADQHVSGGYGPGQTELRRSPV